MPKMKMPGLRVLLLLLVSSIHGGASSITLAPVRVELPAARPYSVLRLTNNGDDPVTLQMRVYRWSFNEQGDVLTPTDDLVINPPIATLTAKKVQLVRIGLLTPNKNVTEATYRLILDEVPNKRSATAGVTLSTILRMSVPIFALPRAKVSPRLQWSMYRDAAGVTKIAAANEGSSHVQIKALVISTGTGHDSAVKFDDPTYLLPQQRHEWKIENEALTAAPDLTVDALTDAGNVRQTITKSTN